MKYCPKCKVAFNDDNLNKCTSCGEDLIVKKNKSKKHKFKSFGDAVQIAGTIVFIINILSSIVGAIWLFTIPEIWFYGLATLFGGLFTSLVIYILMEAFGELVINSKNNNDYLKEIKLHLVNEDNKNNKGE